MSKLRTLFLLLIGFFVPTDAFAVSSNWLKDGAVDVRLVSSLEGVGEKNVIPLGLEVRMEPGWHTYWRSPGATGLPPQIDWTASQTPSGNLKNATILFPAPQRFHEEGFETIGYQGRIVFPIDAEVIQPGHPLAIDATVNLLVCSSICVPKTFQLKLNVPYDNAIEGPEADVVNPWRKLVPTATSSNGLTINSIANTGSSLIFDIAANTTLGTPDILIESDPEIPFSAPEWKANHDLLSGTLTVHPLDAKQDLTKLVETPLLVTLFDRDHAIEVPTQIPELSSGPSSNNHRLLTFRTALILAMIGGFLLNFMPCVLPVLSLKILGFIGHGGGESRIVRRSFFVSAAGILFSFLVLAGATIILKQLGMSLGWGIQFQQPLFLIFLITVLILFAANMWGVYEINLPGFIANKIAQHHPKMAGDFAAGALATLLATPCTAPFMGSAVGFALASGTWLQILAIFMAVGLGMALPYLMIAAVPQMAMLLPKPGAWMVTLRSILGVALALTDVWLMWVLSAQIAPVQSAGIVACLILATIMLGLRPKGFLAKLAHMMALLLIVGVFALTYTGIKPVAAPTTAASDGAPAHKTLDAGNWQSFNPDSIASEVAAGHTVFVDITADWCLTCKVNKKLVLSDEDINKRILHSDVIPMQGDWTSPNDAITNYLHQFRRSGIPFDVVYGPGAPLGITLPELLTHDAVMDAINKASGS